MTIWQIGLRNFSKLMAMMQAQVFQKVAGVAKFHRYIFEHNLHLDKQQLVGLPSSSETNPKYFHTSDFAFFLEINSTLLSIPPLCSSVSVSKLYSDSSISLVSEEVSDNREAMQSQLK